MPPSFLPYSARRQDTRASAVSVSTTPNSANAFPPIVVVLSSDRSSLNNAVLTLSP